VKIAAAAYPLTDLASFADFEAKLTDWVTEAAEAGAELLVFPEYGAMELSSLGGRAVSMDIEAALHEVARHQPAVDALYCALAAKHNLYILGASGPCFTGTRPSNRAVFYGPTGILGFQDKQIMTRFERETWDVIPDGPLSLFDTPLGKIGVMICYDSEFPLLSRRLIEAGAEILLVPSCTDSQAGFTRVRLGAMGRALENQCITVHSPTVGPCAFCPAVDENHGSAAIYGPPDRGFPPTGIFAETGYDQAGWVYAEVDLAAIHALRRDGGVLNHLHWDEQAERTKKAVTLFKSVQEMPTA
jgi:predicted amidohydrolase